MKRASAIGLVKRHRIHAGQQATRLQLDDVGRVVGAIAMARTADAARCEQRLPARWRPW